MSFNPDTAKGSALADSTKDSAKNSSDKSNNKKPDYAEVRRKRRIAELAQENDKKERYLERIASAKSKLVQTTRHASYLTEEIRLKKIGSV